jgi:2-dehydro-3-deoxy-D-arabinonate dehydratase
MILTLRMTLDGPVWALDGKALSRSLSLGFMLKFPKEKVQQILDDATESGEDISSEPILPPIEHDHEVWAAGVTYLRSKVEREAESIVADVYAKVYEADRPELFFKSLGSRVIGDGGKIRIRRDSSWNVPEPELTLVINSHGEIFGYTVGNDVSSRSIEGENPLYLPQAKCYDGACALGPGIVLASAEQMTNLPIKLSIIRGGAVVFTGEANTNQMKRSLEELTEHLTRELTFYRGVFLMTGTCIVPTSEFTLLPGDTVAITVGELMLINEVDQNP